jgi:D-lactate dehydrogenase (cytochrome)
MSIAGLFREQVQGLQVSEDAARRATLSGDLYRPASSPASVLLCPVDAEQTIALVRIARREGVALYPRGGGLSYTGGFTPAERPTALVDMGGLGGIAIDAERGTVSAGAGLSWAALHEALAATGRRAASFGPLSGIGATLGGGAAQNGGFFGAAGHGAYGDGGIVGATLIDGAGEQRMLSLQDRVDGLTAPQPLVGDCGAFGLRTEIVLRTIALPPVTRFASFGFETGAQAFSVLAGLAGLPTLGEAYVFDPGTHANLARSGFSVIESATLASDLLRGGGGLLGRIGGLLKTARAGKTFVADLAWSLHVSLDGSAAETEPVLAEIALRCGRAGGEPIPDIIPRVTRARPFRRIKAVLGPDGESWLPLHGVFAPADAAPALARVAATLDAAREPMHRHGIQVVTLGVLMGGRVIVEPQLFWRDGLTDVQRHLALPDQVQAHGDRPANLEARAAAHALRTGLLETLDSAGAGHFQIGRSYAAHPGVPESAQAAWRALKARFDPDRIMNPGVLGL